MIGAAIVAITNANPVLAGLLGGESGVTPAHITLSVIPQDQPVSCAYVGTDNIKPIPVRDPQGAFSGTLEWGFQAKTYAELDALTIASRSTLDNFNGMVGDTYLTINRGESTPDDYDEERKLHTRALIFSVSGSLTI